MCGTISWTLALGTGADRRHGGARLAALTLASNLGRVTSYALAGAMAGSAVTITTLWTGPYGHLMLSGFASLILIAVGLHLGGWWSAYERIERFGLSVWRHLQPWSSALLPINTLSKAFGYGMVWGWLPCGLVYSALSWSAVSGSVAGSAFAMAAFGLGTLPAVWGSGWWFGSLRGHLQDPLWRRYAGMLFILLGCGLWWLGSGGVTHHF